MEWSLSGEWILYATGMLNCEMKMNVFRMITDWKLILGWFGLTYIIHNDINTKNDNEDYISIDLASEGNVIDSIPKDGERLSEGLNSQPAFWWNMTFIKHSEPYGRTEGALYWYLWHDTENNKVYFLTFDM